MLKLNLSIITVEQIEISDSFSEFSYLIDYLNTWPIPTTQVLNEIQVADSSWGQN